MKKQYTKQQIVEAIKYWESVLKRIDENQQTLMSRLVKIFGEDLVKNQHVNLSQSQFYQLYKILNVFIFDNMLDDIPVKLMYIDKIIEDIDRNNIKLEQNMEDNRKSQTEYMVNEIYQYCNNSSKEFSDDAFSAKWR